jgi:hypothetical protein
LDSLGFLDLVVIHDDIEPRIPLGRIAHIEAGEQVAEQRVGFARP